MKKLLKVLALVAVVACCAVAVAFAGCGESAKTYDGEYKYEIAAWHTTYGVKVEVTVKDDTIQSVKIVDSDYVVVTSTWDNKATWENGVEGLLKAYEGKKVADVKAVKVEVATGDFAGQPESVADSNLMITGATQGSGRLLLAVQDALKNA